MPGAFSHGRNSDSGETALSLNCYHRVGGDHLYGLGAGKIYLRMGCRFCPRLSLENEAQKKRGYQEILLLAERTLLPTYHCTSSTP